MAERVYNFNLKLLTAAKDVGLRRVRSYAASLGGGAQIFGCFDDLQRHLEAQPMHRQDGIILHDPSVKLTPGQFQELNRLSRIFSLDDPTSGSKDLPGPEASCWQAESYLRCSLTTFLESAIVRLSMAQTCNTKRPFHLQELLRWGYAAESLPIVGPEECPLPGALAEACLAFIKRLSLSGEARRMSEMFSHFIEARLGQLGLQRAGITFGCDGLLTTVIARCEVTSDDLVLPDVASDLHAHGFPIAIINRTAPKTLEIGALYYPQQLFGRGDERILLVFNAGSHSAGAAEGLAGASLADGLAPVREAG